MREKTMKRSILTAALAAALCLLHGIGQAVQEDALVLYLDFEEGAGDMAMDGSRHGNNGTIHQAERADGKYGAGVSLSGAAGGWVEVPDAPSLDITDEITLMAWVYPTAFTNEWQRILNKCWQGDVWPWMSYGFYEQANTNGRIGFTIAVDNGQERLCRSGDTPQLPGSEWSHIAATYDGAHMRLYQNGEEVLNAATTGTITTNDVPVAVGRNSEGNREHFAGSIDEVGIWSVALTPGEIEAAMEGDILLSVEPAGKLAVQWADLRDSR